MNLVKPFVSKQETLTQEFVAFQSTGDTVIWDFSCGATRKILFQILDNSKNIPFNIGLVTGFSYNINYKIINKKAYSNHQSFISSRKQVVKPI